MCVEVTTEEGWLPSIMLQERLQIELCPLPAVHVVDVHCAGATKVQCDAEGVHQGPEMAWILLQSGREVLPHKSDEALQAPCPRRLMEKLLLLPEPHGEDIPHQRLLEDDDSCVVC